MLRAPSHHHLSLRIIHENQKQSEGLLGRLGAGAGSGTSIPPVSVLVLSLLFIYPLLVMRA